MTKPILITAGVVSVVFLGVLIDHQSKSTAVRPVAPRSQSAISAPGWVEGASLEIELRPQLAGRIATVHVHEGQIVEQGDVLLSLDDQEHRQQVALAEANVALAEARRDRLVNGARSHERAEAAALLRAKLAELERARLAWNRIRELHEADAVSQQEADNQRTLVAALEAEVDAAQQRHELLEAHARPDELAMAEARIGAARAQRELARVQHERTQLRAPCRGRILDVAVKPGELTGPDAEEPTIIMVNTDKLRVRAFVEELDAPRVELGLPARITADGLPNHVYRGHVTQLSPRMDRKTLQTGYPDELFDTKTREVWIDLDEPGSLVVGLRVDTVIDAPIQQAADSSNEGSSQPLPSPASGRGVGGEG
ncbi:MAG: efflux RND transporter periplasmic adaptor subunit [Pirellulales bacterium]|nr:efflux RND transporter periplasmic adaptor subunit [Pirellulales bacterium]